MNEVESGNNPEFEDVKQKLIDFLKNGKTDLAFSLKSSLPEAALQSDEVKQVVKQKLVEYFSNGYLHLASDLVEQFPLDEQEVIGAVKSGFLKAMSDGLVDEAESIRSEYHIPPEFFNSEEFKSAAVKAISALEKKGLKHQADQIKKEYQI